MRVGDFQAFADELAALRFYYSKSEQVLLLLLGFITCVLVSWRLLICGLPGGLSGKKVWYYSENVMTGVILAALLTYLITSDPNANEGARLYRLWAWIASLPLLLAAAVGAKAVLALRWWLKVEREGLYSRSGVRCYLIIWCVGSLVVGLFAGILCQNTQWLRVCLWLLALLSTPLCTPALAMLTLARNRRHL
jgi:hypothetical protein